MPRLPFFVALAVLASAAVAQAQQVVIDKKALDEIKRKASGSGEDVVVVIVVLEGSQPKKRTAPPTEVVVSEVAGRSVADRLGLRAGDVLLSYNGKPLSRNWELGTLHADMRRDDPPASLIVRRGQELLAFELQPGRLGLSMTDRLAR